MHGGFLSIKLWIILLFWLHNHESLAKKSVHRDKDKLLIQISRAIESVEFFQPLYIEETWPGEPFELIDQTFKTSEDCKGIVRELIPCLLPLNRSGISKSEKIHLLPTYLRSLLQLRHVLHHAMLDESLNDHRFSFLMSLSLINRETKEVSRRLKRYFRKRKRRLQRIQPSLGGVHYLRGPSNGTLRSSRGPFGDGSISQGRIGPPRGTHRPLRVKGRIPLGFYKRITKEERDLRGFVLLRQLKKTLLQLMDLLKD